MCKIDSKTLLYNGGSLAQCSVMTSRGRIGGVGEMEAQEEGGVCTFIADLHCCTTEINKTL